ncbi:hypothetical protein B0T20DRAFT_396924 [Sordaria brevicollis]|uniref:Uncharacterized protein n=1 Tax=Sordaria brevicollis TaxID=83679 RepID=A0AAE0U5A0_SORBR|nr:hypothetical protein B0T20DRAFT_396924 [Sordaria brevicollis]
MPWTSSDKYGHILFSPLWWRGQKRSLICPWPLAGAWTAGGRCGKGSGLVVRCFEEPVKGRCCAGREGGGGLVLRSLLSCKLADLRNMTVDSLLLPMTRYSIDKHPARLLPLGTKLPNVGMDTRSCQIYYWKQKPANQIDGATRGRMFPGSQIGVLFECTAFWYGSTDGEGTGAGAGYRTGANR